MAISSSSAMNFIATTTRSISSKLLFSPSIFSFSLNPHRLISYKYPIIISRSLSTTMTLWETHHKPTSKTPKSDDPFEQLGPRSGFEKKELSFARPTEIPWQKKVSNLVKLIGCIQAPVRFHELPDGKTWAATVISQEKKGSVSLRIPLLFEGDLAHIAASHLKEKDYVYIDGQLSADSPPVALKCEQSSLQVVVHNVNFVEGSSWKKNFSDSKIMVPLESFERDDTLQKKVSRDDDYQREESVKDSTSRKKESVEEFKILDQSLLDLITNPQEWWDIRLKQANSSAAYEHKVDGKVVHINESTPDWIKKELESLPFDRKTEKKSSKGGRVSMNNSGELILNSWRDLLKNSKQWRDYRDNKLQGLVKPNYPDFKNKDSGAALWLDRAPDWVLPGLEGLEFDAPLQKGKKADDDSWKDLLENSEKWWDNRLNKKNPKAPDFKHKDLGTALWLSDTPAWALSKLPPQKV
ncbi:protein OSB4, chloroplastic isoform X1 [Daucus carota subsp. sativus]|uniref:protein OSB4, chloroplastic isoform X1 n=1 Tax=Daucus carota subsp. sativus TaxID=79200 RepID=UPI0007F028E5|nr:PREDICTED: protein OSB4, chloroplastic-like isoform X1 [Daucus carota subsp. sativus]XP_017254728.1 PREDICTED: protein OSB4, chloroplastic-like isoform X1 [Daucus carota subsp. sativus]